MEVYSTMIAVLEKVVPPLWYSQRLSEEIRQGGMNIGLELVPS